MPFIEDFMLVVVLVLGFVLLCTGDWIDALLAFALVCGVAAALKEARRAPA